MIDYLKKFNRDIGGASAIEYALIASLISIVIIGAATVLGTTLDGTFSSIAALIG